jgi:hypothetical protein
MMEEEEQVEVEVGAEEEEAEEVMDPIHPPVVKTKIENQVGKGIQTSKGGEAVPKSNFSHFPKHIQQSARSE